MASASPDNNGTANPAGSTPPAQQGSLDALAVPTADQPTLPAVPDIQKSQFWHVENLLKAQQAYYQQRKTVNEIVELARKEFGYITF